MAFYGVFQAGHTKAINVPISFDERGDKLVPCRRGLADAPLGIVSRGRNCDSATAIWTDCTSSVEEGKRSLRLMQ
jgi:hypothetical protein